MTGTDKLNSGNPVTVTVNAGTTYADAIDQACATSGSGISNAVWTGTTDKYLDSLKVGDKTYTNKGSYPNANTYIGLPEFNLSVPVTTPLAFLVAVCK